jgi:hypothetical protein
VEQVLGILVATLAAAEEAEVCDHLSLELLVSELPQEDERLLEVLNRDRDAAGGVHESESEVVERQRLGAPVAQVTHHHQRGSVLLDGAFVIAVTPKLRAELVEAMCFAAAVDFDRLGLRFPLVRLHEVMGPPGSAVRVALHVLPRGELVQARLASPGDALDRRGAGTKRALHPVAALEPEHSGQDAPKQHEDEGEKQDDAEPESPEEPGQEEPDPRECEDAAPDLLAID